MGLVYTSENCVGCNKCIRACSCLGACVADEREGSSFIHVDPDKCIACGACIDACEHHAREFQDDTGRFPCCWHRHLRPIIRMNMKRCLVGWKSLESTGSSVFPLEQILRPGDIWIILPRIILQVGSVSPVRRLSAILNGMHRSSCQSFSRCRARWCAEPFMQGRKWR